MAEFEVHRDHLCASRSETFDDLRVVLAGEGRLGVELVIPQFGERALIDPDELDIRRRSLGASDRKSRIKRLQFTAS